MKYFVIFLLVALPCFAYINESEDSKLAYDLVNARNEINELKAQNEELKARIKELENQNSELIYNLNRLQPKKDYIIIERNRPPHPPYPPKPAPKPDPKPQPPKPAPEGAKPWGTHLPSIMPQRN